MKKFGFRPGHSTIYVLIEVLEHIYKSLGDGNYVFGIYVDIKKAFATVDHKILTSNVLKITHTE